MSNQDGTNGNGTNGQNGQGTHPRTDTSLFPDSNDREKKEGVGSDSLFVRGALVLVAVLIVGFSIAIIITVTNGQKADVKQGTVLFDKNADGQSQIQELVTQGGTATRQRLVGQAEVLDKLVDASGQIRSSISDLAKRIPKTMTRKEREEARQQVERLQDEILVIEGRVVRCAEQVQYNESQLLVLREEFAKGRTVVKDSIAFHEDAVQKARASIEESNSEISDKQAEIEEIMTPLNEQSSLFERANISQVNESTALESRVLVLEGNFAEQVQQIAVLRGQVSGNEAAIKRVGEDLTGFKKETRASLQSLEDRQAELVARFSSDLQKIDPLAMRSGEANRLPDAPASFENEAGQYSQERWIWVYEEKQRIYSGVTPYRASDGAYWFPGDGWRNLDSSNLSVVLRAYCVVTTVVNG